MQVKEFGTLKKLELRSVWTKEAASFTPWLCEHLPALGDALGLDLELEQREAACGEFSLDILARDVGQNRRVIIENQIEATDHDHLGKLLTYAAGHDAHVVVWIAKEFREEHRQAIDWLNQHTDDDTEFFAVVIEVLQIDDSRPAYHLKLVAFPNDWRKKVKDTRPNSSREDAYRDFFQQLIDVLREEYKFTGARVGLPQSWYSFPTGIAGITYGAVFTTKARLRAEVYIDLGEVQLNKNLFDLLEQQKAEIEKEFGNVLSWERLDNRRASRIAHYRAGSIDDAASFPELRTWLIEQLLRFKKIFGSRLKQLTSSEQQ